jgi:hypothetical protein
MQSLNAAAGGALEQERQDRVHQAGEPAEQHRNAERCRMTQVLRICFPDRLGVICEQSRYNHAD